MNNNHKALWDDCLRLIRANVTEQQFKTWFAPIVFESFDVKRGLHQSSSNRSTRRTIPYWCKFQADMYSSTWSSTTLDY